VTAGGEDGTAGALGRLRTSHADREQAIDVLKAAFVQGRLTKDEFDLRVRQAFASRTYADLDALTADIPDEVTSAQPSTEPAREPGKVLSFKTAARVGSVGAAPSMASAAVVLVQSSAAPAVAGVLLVGLTGLCVAGLLAALLMLLSWVVRRSQAGATQGPPSGPAGLASKRQAPTQQLPSARQDPWHIAQAARSQGGHGRRLREGVSDEGGYHPPLRRGRQPARILGHAFSSSSRLRAIVPRTRALDIFPPDRPPVLHFMAALGELPTDVRRQCCRRHRGSSNSSSRSERAVTAPHAELDPAW
jgi:hypothetical protein